MSGFVVVYSALSELTEREKEAEKERTESR